MENTPISHFKDLGFNEIVNLRQMYRGGLFPEVMLQPMRVMQKIDGIKTVKVMCKDNVVRIVSTWELESANRSERNHVS